MILKDVITAWRVVERLMQEPTSYKLAYGLAKVHKQLMSSVDFYNEKEAKLFDQYAEKDENGEVAMSDSGEVRIPTESIAEFVTKYNELGAVDVEFDPCKIDDCPQTISGADLEALEGVIEFKEPD